MIFHLKRLLCLPVITVSGKPLGRITNVEMDIESHMIRSYVVAPHLFSSDHFLVAPAQVVSITTKKMIVRDAVVAEPETKPASSVASQPNLSGAMTKSE